MKILVASHKIQLLSFQATRSLVLFVLPHYERVKSTRIRWKSDFHLPRPEVELNFSIELYYMGVERDEDQTVRSRGLKRRFS